MAFRFDAVAKEYGCRKTTHSKSFGEYWMKRRVDRSDGHLAFRLKCELFQHAAE